MDILTIGEFVESAEILTVLQDIGIDYAQGFHLGMPQAKLDNLKGIAGYGGVKTGFRNLDSG